MGRYLETEINKDKIRLWKLNCKLEELQKYLTENREDIINSDKKFDIPELMFLECKKNLIQIFQRVI